MKRIILLLTVVLVMTTMLVLSAAPHQLRRFAPSQAKPCPQTGYAPRPQTDEGGGSRGGSQFELRKGGKVCWHLLP
jgi:hypothetical protein